MKEPTPLAVTILGGFLGAGKTTLLSQILAGARGVRIGVLVNDFGEIDVDAELIAEVSGGVMKLTNGCICCTIRSDVPSKLLELIEKHPLDHAIIETSGVSDPRAVAESFLELQRQQVLRLDALVSVVDAERFGRTPPEHEELAEAQVRAADLIVLSKTDLVGVERAAEVEAAIRRLAPRARLLRAVRGQLPLDAILGVEGEGGFRAFDCADHHHPPSHGFSSSTFREERPLRWSELAPILTQLPPAVLRVKGWLNLVERPGDRILLQVVGGRVWLRTIDVWGDRPARTELVLIGTTGGWNAAELEARFRDTA